MSSVIGIIGAKVQKVDFESDGITSGPFRLNKRVCSVCWCVAHVWLTLCSGVCVCVCVDAHFKKLRLCIHKV